MAGILFMQRKIPAALEQAALAEDLLAGHYNYYAQGELVRLRAGVLYPYTGRYRDVMRVLDESERAIASMSPDSSAISGIRVSKAALGFWRDQDVKRASAALNAIKSVSEGQTPGDLVQVKVVFNLLAGDSARAARLLRTDGKLLTPDGRAIVNAVQASTEGNCAAPARLASRKDGFGTNRGAREVLRYTAARCYIDAGSAEMAIPVLRAIVDSPTLNPDASPCYPAAYYELGRAYEATGDLRHAIEAYETLLEMWEHGDPDLPMRAHAEERLRAMKRSM
jgi:tetratricopeptide (TPR) repeat protein